MEKEDGGFPIFFFHPSGEPPQMAAGD